MAGAPYVTSRNLSDKTKDWMAVIAPLNRGRPLPPLNQSALLVLDLQKYFAEPGSHAFLPSLKVILPNILKLISLYKLKGRPVFLTKHGSLTKAETSMKRWWKDDLTHGEKRAEFISSIRAIQGVTCIDKTSYSAFKDTNLMSLLRDNGCNTVVITGVMTHLCVESTARAAFINDIDPIIVADGCASWTEELHLGSLKGLAHGFSVIAPKKVIQKGLKKIAPLSSIGNPNSNPPVSDCLDLVIVGAGPAGITASIQAIRTGLRVILFNDGNPGGWARAANLIENYPGYPDGITGSDLMAQFSKQLFRQKISFVRSKVSKIEKEKDNFRITYGSSPKSIIAKTVIIATGASPRKIKGIPDQMQSYRLDGIENIRSKDILVIGGGETAFDQALYGIHHGAKHVVIAFRGDTPKAMDFLVQRARNKGIQMLAGHQIKVGTANKERDDTISLTLVSTHGEEIREAFHHIIICIGRDPCLPVLPQTLRTDDPSFFRNEIGGKTTIPGLYVVGDARRGLKRQVAIASGDGLAAVMDIQDFLLKRGLAPSGSPG